MSDTEAEKREEETKSLKRGHKDEDEDEDPKSLKRGHQDEDEDNGGSSDDDGWVGPMPSEAAPQKKKKVLEDEKIFLDNLPCAESYERSYM